MTMIRYGSDGTSTVVASWRRTGEPDRRPSATGSVSGGKTSPRSSRGPAARPGSTATPTPPAGPAVAAREAGFRAAAGAPVIVQGRLWGAMIAWTADEHPLPLDTETRLAVVHGTCGDRDRQRPGRAGTARARGHPGGAAAAGHAGRAGRTARGGVRGRDQRGAAAFRRRHRPDDPVRTGRDGDAPGERGHDGPPRAGRGTLGGLPAGRADRDRPADRPGRPGR